MCCNNKFINDIKKKKQKKNLRKSMHVMYTLSHLRKTKSNEIKTEHCSKLPYGSWDRVTVCRCFGSLFIYSLSKSKSSEGERERVKYMCVIIRERTCATSFSDSFGLSICLFLSLLHIAVCMWNRKYQTKYSYRV